MIGTIELYREILNAIGSYRFTTDGRELRYRCPYCGDSKNPNHSHGYIKLDVAPGEPYLYYCHRCQARGRVDIEFLNQFDNEYDRRVVRNYNNELSINESGNRVSSSRVSIEVPLFDMTKQRNQEKLGYLNNRLDLDLDVTDCKRLKIVLSVRELVEYNQLKVTNNYLFEQIEDSYISFLNANNTALVCRSIVSNSSHRYLRYRLMNYPESVPYIIMPNRLTLFDYDIAVIMAEGPFDMLGIYYYLRPVEHALYCSVNGNYYQRLLLDLVERGVFKPKVYIYADRDQSLTIYRKLFNNYKHLFSSFSVAYNTRSKDYGDYDALSDPDAIRTIRFK